jgi:hypothetical protein
MTKLSDTQMIILSAAAQRGDGNVLPLPGSLRGGAATKVVGALLSRGLIAERVTDSTATADPAVNRIWRNEPDGRGVLLLITPAGLDAIGIEPTAEPEAPVGFRINESTDSTGEPAAGSGPTAEEPPVEPAPKRRGRPRKATPTAPDTAAPRKSRDNTKQAQLIAMLRRPEGVTIAQIVEAIGWQPHTVRGAFAGARKKKLGLEVTSEKVEGGERIYRLPPA